MRVIGIFRRDQQGGFHPEPGEIAAHRQQLLKAAKLERLLRDTEKDVELMRQSGNHGCSAQGVVVTNTTFTQPSSSSHTEEQFHKSTRLKFNPDSGQVRSYSTRIEGGRERIELNYTATPLFLQLNAVNAPLGSDRISKKLRLREVGENLFELSEDSLTLN